MQYEKYKEFVINYKPFEWEINFSDFRENMKGKHSFILNFIRFYKICPGGSEGLQRSQDEPRMDP